MGEQIKVNAPEAFSDEAGESERRFLENISRRLHRSQPKLAPKHPFRGAPDFWREYELSAEVCLSTFIAHWESVGGKTVRVNSQDDLPQAIADILRAHQVAAAIRQNEPELSSLRLEETLSEISWEIWGNADKSALREYTARADAGIALADYAVAHTGTVVLCSSSDKGRTVSLLPSVLVVVVPVSRLRTRLGEVMKQLQAISAEQFPAGVHFISGPSRSADIENDLTIGVHGPGVVYAVIAG